MGEVNMTAEELKPMPISELAFVIGRSWQRVDPAALPYLQAMYQLNSIKDKYINDDGKSIVLYFLNNAKTWTGDTARLVKAELRRRCKE